MMADNKTISEDPVQYLTHLLNEQYPGYLNKISKSNDEITLEINDIGLNYQIIQDVIFKQALQKLKVDETKIIFDELGSKIILDQTLLIKILKLHQESSLEQNAEKPSPPPRPPKPTLRANFIRQFQPNSKNEFIPPPDPNLESNQALFEYANATRTTLHTESVKNPSPQMTEDFKKIAHALDDYIKHLPKKPERGHLGGLVGSDQVAKKEIAVNIFNKINDFNKLSSASADFELAQKNLKREIASAIQQNKAAHGFWASLGGPGALEKILLSAEQTLKEKKSDRYTR
jgi:hypothetical protein